MSSLQNARQASAKVKCTCALHQLCFPFCKSDVDLVADLGTQHIRRPPGQVCRHLHILYHHFIYEDHAQLDQYHLKLCSCLTFKVAEAKLVGPVLLQGTSARILETRKTAPGLRVPDKWAVLIGGGSNHRIGLFDMVMIKDNHVTSAGGVVPAIQHAQVRYPVILWLLSCFNLCLPFCVQQCSKCIALCAYRLCLVLFMVHFTAPSAEKTNAFCSVRVHAKDLRSAGLGSIDTVAGLCATKAQEHSN